MNAQSGRTTPNCPHSRNNRIACDLANLLPVRCSRCAGLRPAGDQAGHLSVGPWADGAARSRGHRDTCRRCWGHVRRCWGPRAGPAKPGPAPPRARGTRGRRLTIRLCPPSGNLGLERRIRNSGSGAVWVQSVPASGDSARDGSRHCDGTGADHAGLARYVFEIQFGDLGRFGPGTWNAWCAFDLTVFL